MDGGFARALRRLVPALAALLGANAALSDAGEADNSPDVLDELESTICIAASNWTNSLEEHAKRQSIPVETFSGTISDPARREYLQRRLDATLTAAQQGLIDSNRRQLSEAQRRYRDLVGHEFDLSLCGQPDRRIQRRQAWDAKRQDADSQRQAERLAATDESMIAAACRELQVIKGPPPEARSSFAESDVRLWQAKARESYERLSRAYESRTGRRFDPARCPPSSF
jgi:hypothetical protein